MSIHFMWFIPSSPAFLLFCLFYAGTSSETFSGKLSDGLRRTKYPDSRADFAGTGQRLFTCRIRSLLASHEFRPYRFFCDTAALQKLYFRRYSYRQKYGHDRQTPNPAVQLRVKYGQLFQKQISYCKKSLAVRSNQPNTPPERYCRRRKMQRYCRAQNRPIPGSRVHRQKARKKDAAPKGRALRVTAYSVLSIQCQLVPVVGGYFRLSLKIS